MWISPCIPARKVAFVGENGAGKSTFVKLLTGMLSPSEGTLLLNGKPTEELHPESRFDAQSVVVQDPTHYETFTLYENVFLGETHQRCEEKAIERALAFSGLSALENKLLGKYVGGTDLSGRPVAEARDRPGGLLGTVI
ncbi:MAG: ATP-binding cassette domain-containing protein [Lachnospiraceae bacterium]